MSLKTRAARRRSSSIRNRARTAIPTKRHTRRAPAAAPPARIAAAALILGLLGTIAGGYAFAAASQYFAR